MKLNELYDDLNPRQNRKRVGRGIGSTKGKTCGRGHKGQKSRSGVSVNGFEGGQMPIYRRLPKQGFVNIHRTEYQWINVGDLQKFVDSKKIDASKVISRETLFNAGILKKSAQPVKVLGNGKVKDALKLDVDSASKSAIELIEKAGGKVMLPKPKVEKEKAVKKVKTAKKQSSEDNE